jgi:hypothetical protein
MKEKVGERAFDNRGVALAGLSALIGAATCLVIGLLLALAFPDEGYLAIGSGSNLIERTLAQAVSFSQSGLTIQPGFEVRTVPVLFVLIPILGVAAGVSALASRTAGMPPRERFLWAAAAGIPFATLMAIFSVLAGEVSIERSVVQVEFSFGLVFGLSLIWGALGGAMGMLFHLRKRGEDMPMDLSPAAARLTRIGWTALKPLLLALAIVGVLGTVAWVTQIVREDLRLPFGAQSTGAAVAEQVAYAGDHAIAILPLGAGAREQLGGPAALPIDGTEYEQLHDYEEPDEASLPTLPSYDLFDFSGTMPTYLFVLTLIILIGVPVLLALNAGFAVARQAGATRPGHAAAWGALVGPVWSLTMVLLTALARKDVVGNPSGDSVFIAFLLGGAILGAIGGLLATRQTAAHRPQAASKLGA